MNTALDLPTTELRLHHAMALVRQDRWLLGALSDGKLRILADSSPELRRPYRRTRPLTALGRRCLHERRPLTISALAEQPAVPPGPQPDWELDWPALLYAPVGMPGQRPMGLLIAGARSGYWYQQEEIDYAAALGVALTGLVLALGGPLSRLTDGELQAARLVAQGLSLLETAVALGRRVDETRALLDLVMRKLSLRSPAELMEAWARMDPVDAAL